MMKTYERPMRKDFNSKGKLKQYLISMGVNTEINEDRFHQNENGKMVCDVLICFPDEFEKLTEEHQSFQDEIQTLKKALEEKEKSLEIAENKLSDIDENHQKELDDIEDKYSGEIAQLKEDLHEKDLEIERTKTRYEKELGVFRESIQKEINELDLFDEEYHMKISDHEKALNTMRGNCLKLRVRENKGYSSYIEELDKLGRLDKLMNKDKEILKEMRSYNKSSIDEKAIDVNFNLIEKEK